MDHTEQQTRLEERAETAAQILHARRHRAGTAHTCGKCQAYVAQHPDEVDAILTDPG